MSLTDSFQIALRIPARAAQRAAHGLDATVCSLTVAGSRGPGSLDSGSIAPVLLDESERLTAVILGDFGKRVPALSGLQVENEPAPQRSYRVDARALAAILKEDLEMVAVLRPISPMASLAAETARDVPRRDQTIMGRLANDSGRFGPVVFYSSSEDSLEVLGSADHVLKCLGRLAAWASERSSL